VVIKCAEFPYLRTVVYPVLVISKALRFIFHLVQTSTCQGMSASMMYKSNLVLWFSNIVVLSLSHLTFINFPFSCYDSCHGAHYRKEVCIARTPSLVWFCLISSHLARAVTLPLSVYLHFVLLSLFWKTKECPWDRFTFLCIAPKQRC
jgi:hypothetical protein